MLVVICHDWPFSRFFVDNSECFDSEIASPSRVTVKMVICLNFDIVLHLVDMILSSSA